MSLDHLKKISSAGPKTYYMGINWCRLIRTLGIYENFSEEDACSLEKECNTCQNRFLHKLIKFGCRDYNVEYEGREPT